MKTVVLSKRITKQEISGRQQRLRRFANKLLEYGPEIIKISETGGLTEEGAHIDLNLFLREANTTISNAIRLEGRIALPGDVGIAVPFDAPNLAAMLYLDGAYLAGMPIHMRFPSGLDYTGGLSDIWKDSLKSVGIDSIEIIQNQSGREFGQECISSPEIQHFLIAGAKELIDLYSSPDVANNFSTEFLFGPTRPKLCVLEEANIGDAIKTLRGSFLNSGQICGLYKEVVVAEKEYETFKNNAMELISSIPYGSFHDPVGPIRDSAVFEQGKKWLEHFKNHPDFKILVGGEVNSETNVISPTLVEVQGEIPDDVEFFSPIILLRKAKGDKEVVDLANQDKVHGLLAGIYGPLGTAYKHLPELEKLHGLVYVNGSMYTQPIGWPYGGFGSSFCFMDNRTPLGPLNKKGRFYTMDELTKI